MSREKPPVMLEACGGTQNGVRVEFRWLNDRYSHSISAFQKDKVLPVLGSLEGGADNRFPPSPCLAELHRQGKTLYLSGATSACHWSMSVEVGEARFPGPPEIEVLNVLNKRFGFHAAAMPKGDDALFQFLSFDVACRVRTNDGPAGSHYRLFKGLECLDHGSQPCARLQDPSLDRSLILQMGANPLSPSVHFRPEPHCRVVPSEIAARQLRVGPTLETTKSLPATLQWRYGVWVF